MKETMNAEPIASTIDGPRGAAAGRFWFAGWAAALVIPMLAVLYWNVAPARAAFGDPAMTTLMYVSTRQLGVLAADPVYKEPVNLYPPLFLAVRGVFLKFAGGDVLGSIKLLFAALVAAQILAAFWLFRKIGAPAFLALAFAVAMTGFVFLPSSMTWGFETLYQATNRQLFGIALPALFWIFTRARGPAGYLVFFALLGLAGNTHPGEAITGFLIYALIFSAMNVRAMRLGRVLGVLAVGGLLFGLLISPTLFRFLEAGEGPQVVRKVLSSDERRTILSFASHASDGMFFWLRFLAHPMAFGAALFIAARRRLMGQARCEEAVEARLRGVERAALWGLLATVIVAQALGWGIPLYYEWRHGSLTQAAALYRADRHFLFFTHVLFFCFIFRLASARVLTKGQAALVSAAGVLAAYSGYRAKVLPMKVDYFDFSTMAWAAAIHVAVVAAVFLAWRRPAAGAGRARLFGTVLALSGLLSLAGLKNLARAAVGAWRGGSEAREKTVVGANLGAVCDWARRNTPEGTLFWFDGYDDYVFKAHALRPTLGTISTAETPWFVRGDQAALDYVEEVRARERALQLRDGGEIVKILQRSGARYLVVDKDARRDFSFHRPKVYENDRYAVFEFQSPEDHS